MALRNQRHAAAAVAVIHDTTRGPAQCAFAVVADAIQPLTAESQSVTVDGVRHVFGGGEGCPAVAQGVTVTRW